MKKVLSIMLAIVLVFGMSSASFASLSSSDRITGAVKPIDTNESFDLYSIKPGDTVRYPLTADMFSWKNGATSGASLNKVPVTRSQISAANVQVVTSGDGASVIKSAKIAYATSAATGDQSTAVVEVQFAKPFVSTAKKDFKFNMYLQISRRQQDSLISMEGSLENEVVQVGSGNISVDLSGGKVLSANSSAKNLEIGIGEGVYLNLNVFSGQKYFGYADDSITSADESVISKNGSITDVLHLKTINLDRAGKYVDLSEYAGRFVYNAKGSYLGKTSEAVEYSDTYYLTSNDVGSTLSGGTSGGGSGSGSGSGSGNGNGSGTGSGSGGGSSTGGGTGTTTSGSVEKTEAIKLMNSAITTAKGNGSKKATVSLKGKGSITAEALKSMSSTAYNAGMTATIQADTVADKTVVGRIYINPANASKLSGSIKLGLHNKNANVTKSAASFSKSFKNNLAVVSFDQDNTFGMPVNAAVRVDLSHMSKTNIYFYSYNRATNKYYRIASPNSWIDNSGYLRFTTTLAGDIIISDGALTK